MARTRIGYITNEVIGSYQWPLFDAVIDAAQQADIDLIAYEGRSINSPLFRDTQYNLIFDFVDQHQLDGLLISSGAVFCFVEPPQVAQWLGDRFQLPLASISLPLPGASNVLLRNDIGFKALLEHVIEQHHCRRLVFVSGPERNEEASGRRRMFVRAVAADSALHADYIKGDFTAQSGSRAMEQIINWIDQGQQIDAVVFANDDMAVAGLEYLAKHRAALMNQFVVTGFDDSPSARLVVPSLSTVSQPFEKIAKRAIQCLLDQIEDNAKPQDYWFDTVPIYRNSCGCEPEQMSVMHPMLRFASNKYKMHEMTQTYKVNELLAQLATGLPYFDIKGCYVALYEGGRFPHTEVGHDRIPKRSRLIFAYHDSQHCPLQGAITYNTRQILPSSFLNTEQPQPLLVKPLMFDNQHFGFIVFDVTVGWLEDMEYVRRQVARTLNAALLFEEKNKAVEAAELANEKLRALNQQLETLNELLVKRSVTDELTGLYNRRGFFDLVRQYAITDRVLNRCTLFYVDMNDLKMVNDQLGHQQGDVAIQMLADALRKTFRQEDIIGRIGGDEFVVCAKRCGPDDIEPLEQRFKQVLERCNSNADLPWDVSSCMGYQIFNGGTEQDLERALERADNMLYERKAEYKKQKAEQANKPTH
ncbi:GGDEF domain-containing protein [Neiella marina]|uniref:GGDEF domain-containing protein n=1 Tax=Neiella holothuriorum TaxID=2870530 RepID=A0ABS7EHX9_9GAMM|nr:GGDEF domain-containing protein [Neiella holothuriorum]MBW8191957.1 GGDEF domain-containing protein [Neiella holothuriorum]